MMMKIFGTKRKRNGKRNGKILLLSLKFVFLQLRALNNLTKIINL